MKINHKLILSVLFISVSLFSQSQTTSTTGNQNEAKGRCGTVMPSSEWDAWFNAKVEKYKTESAQAKTQTISLTIPVVVHVIHGGQVIGSYPNLSSAQIKSQIAVLNKDYAGSGLNSANLASTGFSLVGAANCLITFCLAQLDPNGVPLAEPGIERLNFNTKGWPNPAAATDANTFTAVMDHTIKPQSIWDPAQYFNIWVSDKNANIDILGYATFPNGSGLSGLGGNLGLSTDDGIWVWGKCFGNTGSLIAPYNKGRTATHETGHWLGLRHIGGDPLNPNGDCNASDYCADTPPQKGGSGYSGQNFGSPSYPLHVNECGSQYGNMFMNFMDYTDDDAMYLFTPDQSTRMQVAMANGIFRDQLNVSSANLCGGVPYADILLDSIQCTNDPITTLNQVGGTGTLTYSWSATPSVGVTFSPDNTNPNPSIVFSSVGMYTLTTVVSNTLGQSISALEVRLEECMGLNEASKLLKGVSVYPNPSSGKLTISTTFNAKEEIELKLFNSLGELVFSKHFSDTRNETTTLDFSSEPQGIYNLVISSQGQQAVKRIVLTK